MFGVDNGNLPKLSSVYKSSGLTRQCPRELSENFPVFIPFSQLVLVFELEIRVNDPSAGSPTETLLRLLLPLSDKVH